MPLTTSEKKEIEVLIRKEIKDFFDSSNAKQFEKKLLDKISSEINKGGLKKNGWERYVSWRHGVMNQ